MRLHIFDATGDTLVEVADDTLTEAEEIVQREWDRGASLFTKDGKRLPDMEAVKEAMRQGEAEAYMVPMLRGGV